MSDFDEGFSDDDFDLEGDDQITQPVVSNKEDNSPADLKIILLGDSAVGKSKLIERFLMSAFEPRQDSTYALTVFRYNYTQEEKEEKKTYKIDFWDTAGQERFSSMHPSYYEQAHACILVFDCTRQQTYQHLKTWYAELMKYRRKIPVMVVCNKIDINRSVTKKSFKFATKRDLPLHFCSAASGSNVVAMFKATMAKAVAYKARGPRDFMEHVYDTMDYFDQKEAKEKEEQKAVQ